MPSKHLVAGSIPAGCVKIFLDSSAVEHSAVNRTVTGSNPVQGVYCINKNMPL